ncbi:MAG: hypothetical protein ACTSU2_10140 [Promethearchaeota archaeon]
MVQNNRDEVIKKDPNNNKLTPSEKEYIKQQNKKTLNNLNEKLKNNQLYGSIFSFILLFLLLFSQIYFLRFLFNESELDFITRHFVQLMVILLGLLGSYFQEPKIYAFSIANLLPLCILAELEIYVENYSSALLNILALVVSVYITLYKEPPDAVSIVLNSFFIIFIYYIFNIFYSPSFFEIYKQSLKFSFYWLLIINPLMIFIIYLIRNDEFHLPEELKRKLEIEWALNMPFEDNFMEPTTNVERDEMSFENVETPHDSITQNKDQPIKASNIREQILKNEIPKNKNKKQNKDKRQNKRQNKKKSKITQFFSNKNQIIPHFDLWMFLVVGILWYFIRLMVLGDPLLILTISGWTFSAALIGLFFRKTILVNQVTATAPLITILIFVGGIQYIALNVFNALYHFFIVLSGYYFLFKKQVTYYKYLIIFNFVSKIAAFFLTKIIKNYLVNIDLLFPLSYFDVIFIVIISYVVSLRRLEALKKQQ